MSSSSRQRAISRRVFTFAVGGAAAFRLNAQSAPNVLYDPVDLGSVIGYDATKAIAVNGRGQIAGNIANLTAQANEAFVWTPDGRDGTPDNPELRPLGNLSGKPGWIGNGSMASGLKKICGTRKRSTFTFSRNLFNIMLSTSTNDSASWALA